jgi:hypothetical protein
MVSVIVGGTAVVPVHARSYDSSCWASLLTDQKTVHTTPWSGRGTDDLGADLAGYTAIHWQVARPRLSSRYPSPDMCEYQAVVQLRPEHARRLSMAMVEWVRRREVQADPARTQIPARSRMSSQWSVRATTRTRQLPIWPDLLPFVATDGRWVLQPDDHAVQRGPRWRQMRLDTEHAIALVTFSTD